MVFHFQNGPMPAGGSYEEFAELLARLYLTFLPLKERGGDDARDFGRIVAILDGFAERQAVRKPSVTVAEEDWHRPCRTIFDVQEALAEFVREFGLGHPQGNADDLDRTELGRLMLGIFHRYKAIVADFDQDRSDRAVAVSIAARISSDSEPMETILDPRRKERSMG